MSNLKDKYKVEFQKPFSRKKTLYMTFIIRIKINKSYSLFIFYSFLPPGTPGH